MDHSLAAYLGEGPADSSVLRIFRRVLEAVNAIYAAGASHQPLLPQTIRLDDSDQPHIQSSIRTQEMTDTVAFGSAKYSAPEAFINNGESSSREVVDCYVLGFMFYEILIGKRSFGAQFASLENGPPSLWLKWHADPTMKARPLSELRPNLGHFASLIDGMMEKDPSKRINSISQVLRAFSSVEAQTAYNVDPGMRLAAAPAMHFPVVRKRVAFATGFVNQLAALRNPRLAAGALIVIAIVLSALLIHRETASPRLRQPIPAALPPAPPENAEVQPPIAPDVVAPNLESQPPVPLQPESELQIESHLESGAFFLLDDLQPVALSQNTLFTEKITPGPHKFRVVTSSKAFLRLPLNIGAGGEISFLERPKVRFLSYVMLASNAKSTEVYGTPDVRTGLPDRAYQPLPEEGRAIANGQIVKVSLGENPKTVIRLDPLPVGSIRIVLEPDERPSLIPVEITANVPDADILINGQKLTRKLAQGVRIVRLPAGEYRVKLVRADYHDSAEQDVIISANGQTRQLQFTLVPIAGSSKLATSSVPAHDVPSASAAKLDRQAIRPFGRITFHVRPESAQITCRREDDAEAQDCANNQPCLLRAGAYEVTAKADGFKTEVNHIDIGAADDKRFEWKLEAPPALNPADFFENGQTWTVDPNGWWTHTQPGYSFMRANRGIFVFDIPKPSGFLVSKKISLVVNYKNDGNRVLYTIDEHKLHRSERAPGFEMASYSIAHKIPPEADYRLTIELSADRVIIRNAVGQILDNLPLTNAAKGKIGFAGKLKLRVIQARYSPDPNSPAEW